MAADLVLVPAARRERAAVPVVLGQGIRRCLRSAVLWGYVFAATVVSSALSYTRLYTTPLERRRLALAFGANHAAAALFGPAPRLDTAAGFTVFKASMTLTILGAIWGLLTSTRLLRGDEDAGRWELLLTGGTTRGGATGQILGALGTAVLALWAVTAVSTVAVGRLRAVHLGVGDGLYLATSLVAAAAMFAGVGALTSQLAASRRQAAGSAAVVLGLAYGLRMIGDSSSRLHVLVWFSPLGWVEELQPVTRHEPWVFLPIGAFTAVMSLLAVALAGRRDVGASIWPERAVRAPRLGRLGLLGGPSELALRLSAASAVWWLAGMALFGLTMGYVAKAAGSTIVGSSVQQVFTRLGAPGYGTLAYLGVAFLVVAIVVSFQSAGAVEAARAEEAGGRLAHLLAARVSRTRWYLGRLGVATAALVASGVVAGLFVWVGTAAEGRGIGLPTALEAGINAVAPGLFLLGIGALVLGLRPRAATAAVYVVLAWSALSELVGGFFAENRVVLDTSLFHQMASVPAVAPNWTTDGVMVGLALLAMAIGGVALRRRDVTHD